MKLLIQPGAGTAAVVKAIAGAKKSVELAIFRFDRPEIEDALAGAVERGVAVQALIAFTNRGGEKNLRKLEQRFLDKGISVCRTADDLVRYHGKMALIDRRTLILMSFNFTRLDIDLSRSFALVSTNRSLVAEAGKLFDCDCKRQAYSAGCRRFVVSPVNSRERLGELIRGAKRELLIYDPEIADRKMLALLRERRKAGVRVRILGKVTGHHAELDARPLHAMRLHTRTIVSDERTVFLGSQSLRAIELDARREIGIIVDDRKSAAALARVFEADWAATEGKPEAMAAPELRLGGDKALRRVAKAISRRMPTGPKLAKAVRETLDETLEEQTNGESGLSRAELKGLVGSAVKDAVQDAVRQVVVAAMVEDGVLGSGKPNGGIEAKPEVKEEK